MPLRIDISREQEIKSAVEAIMGEVGGVDVLINNAGFGLYGAVEGISIDEATVSVRSECFWPCQAHAAPAASNAGEGLRRNR